MANIDNTTLWSTDDKKFDEITRDMNFKCQRSIDREPGKIMIRTAWGVPGEQIQELADKNPGITFYAEHNFEYTLYDTTYTVEYKAGVKEKVIKVKPAYWYDCVPDAMKNKVPCYEELMAKLISVFKRLDVEVTGSDGDLDIDFVDAEVTITVEHDGYRLRATKVRENVSDMQIFKAHKHIEWRQIKDDTDDNIPF